MYIFATFNEPWPTPWPLTIQFCLFLWATRLKTNILSINWSGQKRRAEGSNKCSSTLFTFFNRLSTTYKEEQSGGTVD